MRKTVVLGTLALSLLALSGCTSERPNDAEARIVQGTAYTSGSTDDGRYFYRTTISAVSGSTDVTDVTWESDSPADEVAVNLTPGRFVEGDGGGTAYQTADNTDALPITVSPDGTSEVVVTVVVRQTSQPDGRVVVESSAGSLEIVPTWG